MSSKNVNVSVSFDPRSIALGFDFYFGRHYVDFDIAIPFVNFSVTFHRQAR